MRFHRYVFLFGLMVLSNAGTTALAHGPQMQITNDNGKIVTRQVIPDGPYSTQLTSPKTTYVMPLLESSGVWYSRPNPEVDAITQAPLFPSGPGLAYGYDLADGGDQAFAAGSVLSVQLIAGLQKWDGSQFVDAGSTQLKAFRGSDPTIQTPDANFAITSDAAPFDSLSLAAIGANYGADGTEAHASIRYALLGDGTSPTSATADGVYLVKMQLTSSQTDLSSSDPYQFVLYKNANALALSAAVSSLNVSADQVQYVPEPGTCGLVGMGLLALVARVRRHVRS